MKDISPVKGTHSTVSGDGILYVDRKSGDIHNEKVPGIRVIKWLYYTKSGNFMRKLIKQKLFSSLCGLFMNTRISAERIDAFVSTYNIDMDEFEDKQYHSFNDFFTRKLKEGKRDIRKDRIISPADGKILSFTGIDISRIIDIKGERLSLKDIVNNSEEIEQYDGGDMFIVRVTPSDYHRFHFPLECLPDKHYSIKGKYHTVSPLAIKKHPKIYSLNRRDVTTLTPYAIMIEIGAALVGSIVQTFTPGKRYMPGDEKGYFKFGGSTVILVFKAGKIIPDSDILSNTEKGYETSVHMGESIAICNNANDI